jgi:hypothetical protein
MALQKEAFQLVIGFMMEGLDKCFGEAMVDILATTATSRDEGRRPLLCGIAIKYERVVANKLADWNRIKVVLVEEQLRMSENWRLGVPYRERHKDLTDAWSEMQRWLLRWVGQKPIRGLRRKWRRGDPVSSPMDWFCDRVLMPTLEKWSRLQDSAADPPAAPAMDAFFKGIYACNILGVNATDLQGMSVAKGVRTIDRAFKKLAVATHPASWYGSPERFVLLAPARNDLKRLLCCKPMAPVGDLKAKELQEQAFQIVINNMLEGLDNTLSGVAGILPALAVSRNENRRPLLRELAVKYERIVAYKWEEYYRVRVAADEATDRFYEMTAYWGDRPEGIYQYTDAEDAADRTRRDLAQAARRLQPWFGFRAYRTGQFESGEDYHHYLAGFEVYCTRILVRKLAEWGRLRD